MTANAEASFGDWREFGEERLCEAALRLLAGLDSEPRFPADIAGLEALRERVVTGHPGDPLAIRIEAADELPRYRGDFGIWVGPTVDGGLRLRQETGDMNSLAVDLSPNGALGEFESIEGFGVPQAEWTAQARADVEAVEQRQREILAEEPELERAREERERRFRLENLIGTRAAPRQDSGGPVVTFVALYITGLVVYYLIPRPPDEELESDDPWADPDFDAAMPEIELSDERGTAYELVDFGSCDFNGPLTSASQAFVPAPASHVTRLRVVIGSATVEIELGPR